MKKIIYSDLLSEGYVIVNDGYDLLTTWMIVEKDGVQFYYYFTSQTLEKIEKN